MVDKETLLENLNNNSVGKSDSYREALSRLASALAVPVSLSGLEDELPPTLRYVGPGAWMETIIDSHDSRPQK
ncbi:hypothetical protein [Breznakiella homolactica]|uniref:Uncharacterized protein n=1 Tax=Breznakiella homolactica TaxID=2798577 RepID=A0A7T7XJ89_9SPIR|nr:hypothetical protein [Breznakiella homolactica]QQO07425.1 hypothetical protein JFL75_10665 [Breznakiella homolactica]